MVEFKDDAYEYSRCNKYGTTIYSCTCPGYGFRHICRHVEFLRRKMTEGSSTKFTFENGVDAVDFVEKWGEQKLEQMKLIGDVFERHGKLYKLE